jgi:NTP pyrophosphatase (non-canonical NTP hydrolase)
MNKAKQERLIKLAEECGELVEIIMKTLQYGYEEHYPGDPLNNKERLQIEIRDVIFWIGMMDDLEDIDMYDLLKDDRMKVKYEKVLDYTQYQEGSRWRP